MAALDRLGLRDNTVVVFLADHGEMLGDHWLLNKGPFHFDGILRVPLIWSWPGRFPAGVQSDALVSLLDVAPTILDLAGVPIPEGTVPPVPEAPAMLPPWPGQVLTPLLEGRATSVQSAVVVENDEDYLGLRLRTVVTDRYQLTVYPGQPYGELFDMQEDPGAATQSLVAAAARRLAARPASAAPGTSRADGQSAAAPPDPRLRRRRHS